MRDLRDPRVLGAALLAGRAGVDPCFGLSRVADHMPLRVPNYRDQTTIQKYGDPRLLPSTLPN